MHSAAGGPGTTTPGPVVLVVPAMGLGARWYRPLLEALAAAGVTAAVTETRGHEEGARPPGRRHDHGYADLVADLDAVTRLLADRAPGPLHLLGHSLGGQVAAALLAQRPAAAHGLVLVASGTPYWRDWRRRADDRGGWGPLRLLALTQGAAAVARVLGHFPGARFGFAGREAPTQTRDWARLARTGRLRFAGLDGRVTDHREALTGLCLPVLAITLAGDDLAPPRSTAGLLGWLPAAHVERHHLAPAPGTGLSTDHLRWVRTPAVVVPVLTDWLGALDGPSGTSP